MFDSIGFRGQFGVHRYEDREVLREIERGDPVGEAIARRLAYQRALLRQAVVRGAIPKGFERVAETHFCNTVANAYYDLVFDTMLKGDSYTANVRIGVFGNDVTPAANLLITTFDASLGEATGYTVDGGNATNRASTTFAASASQVITNAASPSQFLFTGADTIYGAFVTQGATLKDGSQDVDPAVYVAGGKFAAAQPVADSSIINVVYQQSKT